MWLSNCPRWSRAVCLLFGTEARSEQHHTVNSGIICWMAVGLVPMSVPALTVSTPITYQAATDILCLSVPKPPLFQESSSGMVLPLMLAWFGLVASEYDLVPSSVPGSRSHHWYRDILAPTLVLTLRAMLVQASTPAGFILGTNLDPGTVSSPGTDVGTEC